MDLISKFLESIKNGNYSIALIIVMIFLIIKLRDIYKFYQEIKQQKIQRLKDLQNINDLDEKIKSSIKDSINNEVFYILTGINAEKYRRNKIIEICENSQGMLSYKDLKMSQKFLNLENNNLLIKITIWDKIEKWFNISISFILIIIASYFISIPSLIKEPTLLQIAISLLFGIFTYLFAGFTIAQTFPIRKAENIKDILENLTKQSNQ